VDNGILRRRFREKSNCRFLREEDSIKKLLGFICRCKAIVSFLFDARRIELKLNNELVQGQTRTPENAKDDSIGRNLTTEIEQNIWNQTMVVKTLERNAEADGRKKRKDDNIEYV